MAEPTRVAIDSELLEVWPELARLNGFQADKKGEIWRTSCSGRTVHEATVTPKGDVVYFLERIRDGGLRNRIECMGLASGARRTHISLFLFDVVVGSDGLSDRLTQCLSGLSITVSRWWRRNSDMLCCDGIVSSGDAACEFLTGYSFDRDSRQFREFVAIGEDWSASRKGDLRQELVSALEDSDEAIATIKGETSKIHGES